MHQLRTTFFIQWFLSLSLRFLDAELPPSCICRCAHRGALLGCCTQKRSCAALRISSYTECTITDHRALYRAPHVRRRYSPAAFLKMSPRSRAVSSYPCGGKLLLQGRGRGKRTYRLHAFAVTPFISRPQEDEPCLRRRLREKRAKM